MTSSETAQGADPGDVRGQFVAVVKAEDELLLGRATSAAGDAPAAPPEYRTGLCLSGGGIRSVSVSLGALQVLARHGMLKHLDYLSSVSGGGYTAAALTLRYAQAAKAAQVRAAANPAAPRPAPLDPDEAFPFKPGDPALRRLRHAANYLAPNGLAGYLTGFVVVARSLVLNVFIWLFLGGLAFAVLMGLFYESRDPCPFHPRPDAMACGYYAVFDWLFVVVLGLGGVLAALVAGYSLSGWRLKTEAVGSDDATASSEISPWRRLLAAAGAVAFAVAVAYVPGGFDFGLPGSVPTPLPGASPALVRPLVAVLLTASVLVFLWATTPLIGPRLGWPIGLLRIAGFLGALVLIAWFGAEGIQAPGDSAAKVSLAAAGGLALVLARPFREAPAGISPKYARRRVQERASSRALLLLLVFLLLAAVPFIPSLAQMVPDALSGKPDALAGTTERSYEPASAPGFPLAVIYMLSAVVALFGYYRTRLQGVLGTGTATLLVVGSGLLVYATAVLAQMIAVQLLHLFWAPQGADPLAPMLCVAGVVAALFLAFVVNINDVSLGRYYRDRLTEAFMPDADTGADDLDEPATLADRFRLTQIADHPDPPTTGPRRFGEPAPDPAPPPAPLLGPYTLINTYVVRRRSPVAATRRRGGDSFLISPLYCGSTETGYKRTGEVIEGELTLATAMAISGAAANPGGGLAGRGVTTRIAVVVAMSLLSLRLGYRFRWDSDKRIRQWLNPFGNHIFPAAAELALEIAGKRSRRNTFVELSDGGHFDNIGIYELIRRRCGLIIVCDGGQDPAASYESFISALTLVQEDFHTRVDFDMRVRSAGISQPSGPEQVVARSVDDEYPRAADFARSGYFLATLRYPEPSADTLPMAADGPSTCLVVYLKSAMVRSLSLASRGYKGANPEFPYEPTSDQFFSPEQFEAYRDVGHAIATQMFDETGLDRLFAGGRPPHGRLLGNVRFARKPRSEEEPDA